MLEKNLKIILTIKMQWIFVKSGIKSHLIQIMNPILLNTLNQK